MFFKKNQAIFNRYYISYIIITALLGLSAIHNINTISFYCQMLLSKGTDYLAEHVIKRFKTNQCYFKIFKKDFV